MELEEIRTFIFKTEEKAEEACNKINKKFGNIVRIILKDKKKIGTTQPESLTKEVVKYVEEELDGKMINPSFTCA